LVLSFFKNALGINYGVTPSVLKNPSSFLNYSNLKNDKDACKKLDVFIGQVKADKSLKFSQKIQLLDAANTIKVRIGC
jgi:hypothetical protein